MNVKLDENVPAGLASLLEKHGHDVVTVPQQGLAGQPDAPIWEATQGETRFLITMDLDFADIRRGQRNFSERSQASPLGRPDSEERP